MSSVFVAAVCFEDYFMTPGGRMEVLCFLGYPG